MIQINETTTVPLAQVFCSDDNMIRLQDKCQHYNRTVDEMTWG